MRKLEIAKRAKKRQRAKKIITKIKNSRKDFMHKLSTMLMQQNALIFIGNLLAEPPRSPRTAQAVVDTGWSALRVMLRYKCEYAGTWLEVIDENSTTQYHDVNNVV